jgi:transposase
MRYELTDYEWAAIKPFLPNKPRGVPRRKFHGAKLCKTYGNSLGL